VTLVVTLAVAGTGEAGVGAVGGKGASLGELARAGVAVPPGFVVTVAAFAAAMAAIDPSGAHRAEVEALPAADLAGIAAAAARFRALVAAVPLPDEVAAAIEAGYAALGTDLIHGSADPDVAVRSSATVEDSAEASFAGLQDTYLGICGAAAVLDHVRRCWASLYNDESVAYRRRLGLPEAGVAMAVVVQRMVAPRAAGVMFTRSPVTGDRSVVAIEGVWGLGSALVSGDVTPDSWVISKITGEISGRRISPKVKIHSYLPNGFVAPPSAPPVSPGGQDASAGSWGEAPGHVAGRPTSATADTVGESGAVGRVTVRDTPQDLRDAACLTDDEIRALASVARRVEAHYGAPQDIEWAVLDAPFTRATETAHAAPAADAPDAPVESRIVLLQSRPETVWASREIPPAGVPKPRAADHVLGLFGKPL
jgi:pyruvate, water dikinase